MERTGRDGRGWVALLGEAGATELPHRDIAKLVGAQLDDGWWTQTVAVGYERLRGLRTVGQQRDGTFQASKSKTLRVPREQVFTWLVAAVDGWEVASLDGHTASKSVRVVEGDGSKATLWLAEKGEDRCTVSVAHRGLPSEEAVQEAKARWASRLAAAVAQPGD